MRSDQTQAATRSRPAIPLFIAGVAASCAGAATALAALRILRVSRHLHHTSRRGREVSASVVPGGESLTTFNREGRAGDPINLQLVATTGQLAASFAAAGWYRADEIDLVTSARISADSVLGRKYSTAPVSNLYLYGRKEDYAFERPGQNVRQRDHVRFWNTGTTAANGDGNGNGDRDGNRDANGDGRPIWVGSATKDVKVELSKTNHLPTHGISPDLDAERALVVSDLAQTSYVVGEGTRPGFGKETHGENGGGDPYVTDGQVAVLTLANVWTLPLVSQVRSPLGGRIARAVEQFIRGRLPKAGRDRAAREVERLRRGADARVAEAEAHIAAAHEHVSALAPQGEGAGG